LVGENAVRLVEFIEEAYKLFRDLKFGRLFGLAALAFFVAFENLRLQKRAQTNFLIPGRG